MAVTFLVARLAADVPARIRLHGSAEAPCVTCGELVVLSPSFVRFRAELLGQGGDVHEVCDPCGGPVEAVSHEIASSLVPGYAARRN